MGRSLVIVESPAKARTINKYLGKGYVVKSSVGHVRDLPTSGSERGSQQAPPGETREAKAARALVGRMGVDPEHGWTAHYQTLPGKEKVIRDLRKAAEDASTIFLATDLDREGEAIAWHLREVIGGDPERYRRVMFSEITKHAIQEAFAHPTAVNMDRVNAQQARRFLDRVVGFLLSPLLWKKVARGLSAGRVQSVAVRLVVEREREIHAFVSQEYWEIFADLRTPASAALRAQVLRREGKAFEPTSQAEASAAVESLKAQEYRVLEREDKPARSRPSAPFITSTLQQAASVRLGFSVKRTMSLAQALYESGHITYMRTDSTNLSGESLAACRTWLGERFGERYVPEKPRFYASAQQAQEAHEAIRPTDVRQTPEALAELERDHQRIYELIWRQFVASQMPDAEYDTTSISIGAGPFELRAKGRVLRFDGWTKVLPPLRAKGEDEVTLPQTAVGQVLALVKLDPSQHFTKPPPRYTEASLVRELEKRGIGRPSTYAAIISTVQERGYVRQDQRRFYAMKIGEIVTDRLRENFDHLMDYGFTASLEQDLDRIASGQEDWKACLDRFYADFKKRLADADDAMRGNPPIPVAEVACLKCARPMAIRTARTGVFLSCTGYGLPKKEQCTATINLTPGEEAVHAGDEETAEIEELRHKRRCPLCGAAMDSYLIDEKRKLHVCGRNPDCPGQAIETGTFRIKGYEGPVLQCDKCGAQMQLRSGRFGKFFGCTNPACKNTRKLLRSGQAAPPRSDPIPCPELPCTKGPGHMVLRDGAVGLFLAASTYPRVRETRNPLVSELKAHAAALPEKYRHLAEAPERDPEGRPALVRFSRKTRAHFVASEADGKPTGWAAFWDDGRWQEQAGDQARSRKTVKTED